MSFKIEICPLTGLEVMEQDIIPHPENIHITEYRNLIIGGVILNTPSYNALQNLGDKTILSIIAGICRHYFQKYGKSFEVKYDFVKSGYRDYEYPKTFNEKALYYLKYLYENGGAEYKSFDVRTYLDYTLSYAEDEYEFDRIITKLIDKNYIFVPTLPYFAGADLKYRKITLNKNGIQEIEKTFPKIPMVGLVDQDIKTGDLQMDDKINHAKKLFFKSDATIDDKRSACETLSYVLEPLRDELKSVFTDADVNAFFRIVNEFDIRHNKDYTKDLKYEEQLEWVFYTLLNTITCYVKLKNKIILFR